MPSFNRVILAGNLTRDPELRYTPKGTAVAGFSLAVNRTWKTESGESKEEVSFIEIEAWGRQGEVIAQYMRKGRPLLIEGRLKQDTWEDKNTKQKQSKLKVVLESFTFIDSNRSEGGAGAPAAASDAPRRPAAAPATPSAKGQTSHPSAPPAPPAPTRHGLREVHAASAATGRPQASPPASPTRPAKAELAHPASAASPASPAITETLAAEAATAATATRAANAPLARPSGAGPPFPALGRPSGARPALSRPSG